ncbi:hypothetical protein [Myroides sp. LJL119]
MANVFFKNSSKAKTGVDFGKYLTEYIAKELKPEYDNGYLKEEN